MSGDGQVVLSRSGRIANVLFDRPEARNAMTPAMYKQLDAICTELASDDELRAVVFRGAGGQSFIAGSDIARFLKFEGAEDGITYEKQMDAYLDRILSIPVPCIAVIEGWAVGGGLNIAAACDIRIATSESKFGVPIARTIGNCLSLQNYARLVAGFGEGRAKRMLLLGDMLNTDEAFNAGFVARVVAADDLEETVTATLNRIESNAPLTLRVSKEAISRVLSRDLEDAADLIRQCYGSEDFKTGVKAFINKEKPDWSGR